MLDIYKLCGRMREKGNVAMITGSEAEFRKIRITQPVIVDVIFLRGLCCDVAAVPGDEDHEDQYVILVNAELQEERITELLQEQLKTIKRMQRKRIRESTPDIDGQMTFDIFGNIA